jgi:hypothetical protein
VYDAPEIWTNSSALFTGVELPLYRLLAALDEEGPSAPATIALRERCAALLQKDATLELLLARAGLFLTDSALAPFRRREGWPHHTTAPQLQAMLAASEACAAMSADPREPVVGELSRAVVEAVGRLMLDHAWEPDAPVRWLGHDVVAKRLVAP